MRRASLLVFALGLAAPLLGVGGSSGTMRAEALLQHPPLPPTDSGHLSERNRIAIVRDVGGEFAKVVKPLPSVKPGFRIKPGDKVDQSALDQALVRSLPAANPGDTVQITGIEFKSKEIFVNINGGSHPHKSLRDRIHISVGMPWPSSSRVVQNQPPGLVKVGSTLILDFGGPVPDVTPAQLKQYLSPFLNFADQRSASQVWVDTLPPEFRKAIAEHRAVVGMSHDMVLAALGRADRKVREFRPDGTQTEDWIYGSPPGTTIFVTFVGDKAIRVKQYP
jgi:hypothetical protein